MSLFSVRTDLAVESCERHARGGGLPPGVEVQRDQPHPDVGVTRVRVTTPQAEKRLGKKRGHYATIECKRMREHDRGLHDAVGRVLQEQLKLMLPSAQDAPVLVVGMGNWNATPDALGPRVVNLLMVTRHLRDFLPRDLSGRLRSVAAISPGVLGITGIETGEIVRGIVERVRPAAVLCVDALAASDLERLFTTIQIADTGIQPGSGVGGQRAAITPETLGVPVIAMGVPTVVHALTIALAALEAIYQHPELRANTCGPTAANSASPGEEVENLAQYLPPLLGEMLVTPKEIDQSMREMAQLLAGAINAALHPGWCEESVRSYLV